LIEPYAHDAVLTMDRAGDVRAPGGAITTELCGHWEHEPPCPLAPHHTRADRDGDRVRLHVLFAVEPEREAEVRARIEAALVDPRWSLVSASPGTIGPDEAGHAARLAGR
jgi:hypothetical protein